MQCDREGQVHQTFMLVHLRKKVRGTGATNASIQPRALHYVYNRQSNNQQCFFPSSDYYAVIRNLLIKIDVYCSCLDLLCFSIHLRLGTLQDLMKSQPQILDPNINNNYEYSGFVLWIMNWMEQFGIDDVSNHEFHFFWAEYHCQTSKSI